MLKVRDLLEQLELRLLAGESGLDVAVRGVQSSDLLDPTPWLSSGDLLLTSGTQLARGSSEREFVTRLVDHEIAGVGLGADFMHDESSATILSAADEHGLALFEVPDDLPFIAVARAASLELAKGRHATLEHALAAQETLERSMLSHPGLQTLVETLSKLLSGTVMLLDNHGLPLVESEPRAPLNPRLLGAVRAEIRERNRGLEPRALKILQAEENFGGFVFPVFADGSAERSGAEQASGAEAWLMAVRNGGELSDTDRVLLRQAVPFAALQLLRHRMVEETERREATDLLAALLSGELLGGDLAGRLAAFGLTDSVAAIVLERPEEAKASLRQLESALASALKRESAPGPVACSRTMACALVAGLPNDELFELAARVGISVTADSGSLVRVGVGRAVALAEARKTFEEARCALEALSLTTRSAAPIEGQRAGAQDIRIATFRDLGSYQLLLSLQGQDSLRLFCDSILGPIEAMETAYGGELLRSLQVFIEANGQWERAARQLFCHRHTLRYRIRKIEELTGRDLESASDRIEFYLALRARGLLS